MEFINGLAAIIFLLSCIAFLIGMIKPKFLKLKDRKQVALVTIATFIAFLIIFSVTSSDEQKAQMQEASEKSAKERELAKKEEQAKLNAEKEAEEVAKLDQLKKQLNFTAAQGSPELIANIISVLEGSANSIEKTELENDSLDVYLKAKTVWDEKQTVFDSGMKGAEIISKLKEKGVNNLKTLRVHASAELLDKYDNKFNEQVFFIEYDYPEVLKLNSDSYILYQPYLRFATIDIVHPVGRKALNDWCNDGSNASLSGSFCLTAN